MIEKCTKEMYDRAVKALDGFFVCKVPVPAWPKNAKEAYVYVNVDGYVRIAKKRPDEEEIANVPPLVGIYYPFIRAAISLARIEDFQTKAVLTILASGADLADILSSEVMKKTSKHAKMRAEMILHKTLVAFSAGSGDEKAREVIKIVVEVVAATIIREKEKCERS